jgi:hypothetical protein
MPPKLKDPALRRVVATSPTTYGVFNNTTPKPEAVFLDALDARCFAAISDTLDEAKRPIGFPRELHAELSAIRLALYACRVRSKRE